MFRIKERTVERLGLICPNGTTPEKDCLAPGLNDPGSGKKINAEHLLQHSYLLNCLIVEYSMGR